LPWGEVNAAPPAADRLQLSRLEAVIVTRAYWRVMKNESPFFDRIKVKPDKDRRLRAEHPACEWPGCDGAATHRAPKGRLREKEYWRFCLAHVREYNHSYNFFAGMSTDDIAKYQRDAVTGHRPTWKMGTGKGTVRPDFSAFSGRNDPFEIFGEGLRAEQQAKAETRQIRNAERKALDRLGLDVGATPQQVKIRFKALVKQFHPDANGGDRSTEDRLVEVIQSYNYLKSVGFA
jgi:hypothetical protein